VISRQWRGLAHLDQAQNYVKHLRTETLKRFLRCGKSRASLAPQSSRAVSVMASNSLSSRSGTRWMPSPGSRAQIWKQRWCLPSPRR